MAEETRRNSASATMEIAEGRSFSVMRMNAAQKSGRSGVLLLLIMLVMAWPCRTQNQAGAIRGQVTDPSGAALVGATVLLTTPSGASMDTSTNKEGMYEFKNLAAGTYEIKAVAAGFALFDKKDIALAAGQSVRLDISLNLEVEKEKVEVNSSTTQADFSPQNNANRITRQGQDMETLSNTRDKMPSDVECVG